MTDRNRSDLEREQRGSSNPNQTDRTENRSTRESGADEMGGASREQGNQGSQSENRGQGSTGSTSEGGNRSTGNIEGDENLNRR
jgi:hypothetical protein